MARADTRIGPDEEVEEPEEAEEPEEGEGADDEVDIRDRPAPASTAGESFVGAQAAIADPPRANVGPAPRQGRVGVFLPFSDVTVDQLAILDANGRRLAILRRPFPAQPEHWIAATYGIGRYRIAQRDERGRHVGSRTVHVTDQGYQRPLADPVRQESGSVHSNGNGAAPQAAQVPAGTDYRLALVTVGLPIIASIASEFAKAISARPQRSEIETLLQAAKILNTPNEERAKLMREGMELYKELAESTPLEGAGEIFNIRDILSGLGELLRSWRESRPAPVPAAAAAAAAPPAGELQAKSGETSESFVERVIVTEIQRAVGSGDSPECLVLLIESWLPSPVVGWLANAPEEEVLEELPKKFPAHIEYLKQIGVQQFLRSALQMLREDPEAEGEGPTLVRKNESAAAAG